MNVERRIKSLTTGIGITLYCLVMLLALSLAIYIPRLRNSYRAQNWIKTPCVVDKIGITGSSSAKGGTSLWIMIEYSYTFEGCPYRSDLYSFKKGGGARQLEKIVKSNPRGTQTTCYVNPAYPFEAVMDNRPFSEYLNEALPVLTGLGITVILLITLIFFLVKAKASQSK
jgi:hypothetical protein